MNLILRELTQNDEKAFLEGLKEWEGEDPKWHSFAWNEGMTFPEMLEILRKEKAGIDLPPGRVKHTMLYGFLQGKIIGRISIRHVLNDSLLFNGGNVGYAVAPRFRKNGYATEIVKQGLEYCRSIGMNRCLVVCADDNKASRKLIEKFGGVLENQVWDEETQERLLRFWISL